MKRWLFVLPLVLLAHPVAAQDSLRLPLTLYTSAAALDSASTAYCLSADRWPCHEVNPLISWLEPAGVGTMLAFNAAMDATVVALSVKAFRTSHPRALKVGLYAASAFRFGLAAKNFKVGYHDRQQWFIQTYP